MCGADLRTDRGHQHEMLDARSARSLRQRARRLDVDRRVNGVGKVGASMRQAGGVHDSIDATDDVFGSERTRHVAERDALDTRIIEDDWVAGGGANLITAFRKLSNDMLADKARGARY